MTEIICPTTEETVSRYAARKAEEAKAIMPKEAEEKFFQSLEDLLLLRDTAVIEDDIADITRSRGSRDGTEKSDSEAATTTSQTVPNHTTVNTSTAPLSPKTTAQEYVYL